jgi:hypothetical protein
LLRPKTRSAMVDALRPLLFFMAVFAIAAASSGLTGPMISYFMCRVYLGAVLIVLWCCNASVMGLY